MAKCLNPLMSTEARGRSVGLVYNTWRGVRTIKVQTSPAQPRTALQLKIRAWMTGLVRTWQTLPSATRAAWNDYATDHPESDWTNKPRRLTGLNWFCRNNIHALMAGQLGLVSPPTVAAPDPVTDFAAANGAGQSAITWTDPGDGARHLDIWMHGPHSAGRAGSIIRSAHKAMANAATESETITGLIAGTYDFYARVIDDNTGLASAWVSDTATVT
jgi:hypothetical protein